MKKRLFIFTIVAMLMACLFAITVSARTENYDATFTLGDSASIVHYEKWFYNDGKSFVRKSYTDTVTLSFIDEEGNPLTTVPMWEYDEEEGKYYSLVWYISDYKLTWEDQIYTDANVGDQTYPKYTSALYTLSPVRAVDLRFVLNQYNTTHDAWKDAEGNKITYSLSSLKGIYLPAGDPNDESDDIRLQHAQGIGRDNDNYGYFGYDAQFEATGNKIVVANFRDCTFERDEEGNYGTANTFSRADNLQCIWLPDTVKYWVGGGLSSCYEIDLGDGIEIIACQIIRDNKRIKSLRIPNSVLFINNECFRGSDLTSLVIGEGVILHGNDPFLYTGGADYITLSKNLLKDTYITANIPKLVANQKAVVYFDGTKAEAEALFAKIQASDSGYKNVGYYDYQLTTDRASTNELSIFYNYNRCEAFYYNEHAIVDDKNCETQEICTRLCGVKGAPALSHNNLTTYKYDNGLTEKGLHSIACQNAGCEVKTLTEKAPLFTAKGYSLSPNKMAISGGYTINIENLELYEDINGNITYGIVIANSKSFGGGSFFTDEGKVNSTKALQVEIDSQYTNFDCSINFGATSNNSLNLIICAYVIDANGVTFIQADAGDIVESSDVSGGSFKSVTLDKVVALVPPSNDEE